MNYHHHQIMAALIFPVIALTLVPEAVGLLKGPVTRGPEPTQTAGVREVSATVEGQNIALQCPASEINEDATIVCTRGNQTVLYHRDGRPDPDGQHPSYVGRVKYELKNDSLSLNLMNVSFSDSETFKCITKELNGTEVITSDICSVNLSVKDSGPKAGGNKEGGRKEGGRKEGGRKEGGCKEGGRKEGGRKEGGRKEGGREEGGSEEGGNPLIPSWVICLIVVGLVVICGVIGFMVYKRLMKKKSEQPAADEEEHLTSPESDKESVEDQCESKV